MRALTRKSALAGALGIALLASACGGGDDDDDGGAEQATGGSFTEQWGEPENPLIPGNTSEVQGGKVIDAIFTGLIGYAPDDAATVMENAESIETTDDGKSWTVTLKDGWNFQDGTPVTAESYVNAWNFVAYAPNGMSQASFFGDIEGYDQVTSEDPDGDGPQVAPVPASETMSGLEVVDDKTFTVTLAGEGSNIWPAKVGYSAFMPLPESFFADPDAFAAAPVGNGPWTFKDRQVNVSLTLEKWADYQGTEQPKADEVVFQVYQDDEAAYSAVLAGETDFMQQVPTSKLTGEIYAADFGDRSVNQPTATSQFVAFPYYVEQFQDIKVRQALSLAIDRVAIIDAIFAGTRPPMNGFTNPNVAGYEDGACGEWCTFDADRAKQLWAEAMPGGWTGPPLTIAYNADGPHGEWVEATCNSIRQTLEVDCQPKPIATFDEFRTISEDRTHTSLYRSGWQSDYPDIENWLNPLFRTGASSNDGDYTNPEFDALMAEGDGTSNIDDAHGVYREAEQILGDDLANIPMWHYAQQSVWSENLSDVKVNIFGELVLDQVTVNQ